MKIYVCILALISYSLALPTLSLVQKGLTGKNVYIEPISNYSVGVPPNGRIIGGDEVKPNSVPYQVALIIDGLGLCGGSLISNNYVLSAAHCTVSASFVELVFGAHNIQTTEPTQVRTTSTSVINHPQYTPSTLANDISLVRIPNGIITNNNIQIIPLAPATSRCFARSTAFMSGWGLVGDDSPGLSPVLRSVNVTVICNRMCANIYGSEIIISSTLCTSGEGIVGGCQSDSGGPLVVNGVQVGVVSFGSPRGCEAGDPTGFARVSAFRNWIAQNSDVPL